MNDIFDNDIDERFYDNKSKEEELLDGGDDYYDEFDRDDDREDEELSEEEDKDENDEEKDEEKDEEARVHLSFACDDCDYRWDDVIVGNKDKIEREEFDIACPMCGSIAITQI